MAPKNPFFFLIALFGISLATFADEPIYKFGTPQVGGTGCPSGSVAVALTEYGSVLSVLFDKFSVEAIKGVTPMTERITKSCTFRIPVQLQPGYTLETTQIYYSGYANVPAVATASITTTGLMFTGRLATRNPAPLWTNLAKGSNNFQIAQTIAGLTQTSCNGNNPTESTFVFTTSIQISVFVRMPAMLFGTMMVIDSADVVGNAPIKFAIRARRCP